MKLNINKTALFGAVFCFQGVAVIVYNFIRLDLMVIPSLN
jgi:hypothetical protein